MPQQKISSLAIPRLSLYYRALLEGEGREFIRSEELARVAHCTAASVRRDLAYFGQFGKPGIGYRVAELKEKLLKILGIDTRWNIVIIGAGNLGSALLSYKGFTQQGFTIVCGFDADPMKRRASGVGIPIKDIREMSSYVRAKHIKMAIVAVPATACQGVVDTLVRSGVRAILNFAPCVPHAPESVNVLNVDLSIELEKLAYFLNKNRKS